MHGDGNTAKVNEIAEVTGCSSHSIYTITKTFVALAPPKPLQTVSYGLEVFHLRF
jgi:hypothetical protein